MSRQASISRVTKETEVEVSLDLDTISEPQIDTEVGFLQHMLTILGFHARIGLQVKAKGDSWIDDHHLVEDVGIAFGQAVAEALGKDKKGINRYGFAYAPLDEALSRVVIDFSGRPSLHYRLEPKQEKIGTFDVCLIQEFFQGFANHAACTLHLDNLYGSNAHHQIESSFKAFAQAFRQAIQLTTTTIPSTKGLL